MKNSLLLLLMCLLLSFAIPALAVVPPSLTVGSGSALPGQTVQIPITLATEGANISSVLIDLKFDGTLLSAPTAVLGSAGTGKTLLTNTLPSGAFRIAPYDLNNTPFSNGAIVNVTFTVAATAATGTTINLTYDTATLGASDPSGNDVAITGVTGTITIPVPLTVPGAPTISAATAGNSQATVTFTAPANTGGSAITGYTVTSSPAGGVDSNSGTTGLSHVITGLTNGTAYTFTVTATNITGTSSPSAASSPVTPATVPGAPTAVSAISDNAQATVTFTAPASNGGSPVTGYTVTSNPAGGTDSNAGTTAASHTITGLTNGTAYTFTVVATNAKGSGTTSSASNSVIPVTVPGAPTVVAATAGNAQATVTFTAPTSNGGSAITGYTVTSNPAGGTDSNAGSTATSHTITGLTNSTAYTFTVVATNAKGSSAASAASNSATPQATIPGAPTKVTAVPGNSQATVSFTIPANNGGSAITLYTVTSNPSNKTATGTASPITVTGLTNGTLYQFTVTATNPVGTGSASAASTAVIPNLLTPAIGAPSAAIVKSGASVTYTVTYTGADVITLATGDVTVNKSGSANGTAAVSGSGATTRTVTISGITGDGSLGISIASGTASASGGAITASASAAGTTFIVDNSGPTLTVETLANGITTSNNTLTITGTVGDTNGVSTVTVNGNAVTPTNGKFNTSEILKNIGANSITVVATDAVGNQNSDSRTIIYDPILPVITFALPTPADQSYTNQQTVTIAGTVSKPGKVEVTVGTNTPIIISTTGAQNSFTTQVTLALGINRIDVKASDTATPANSGTNQRSFTYDVQAPALAIVDPDQAITTTFSSYLVKGTLADNFNGATLAFAVDGVAVSPAPTVGTDGSFQQSVSFSEGKTYHITATATDLAGNVTTVQRNIIYRTIGLADALRALRISMGIETYDLAKGDDKLDVGPLVDNKPHADGVVDISDAVVLVSKSVGLVNW